MSKRDVRKGSRRMSPRTRAGCVEADRAAASIGIDRSRPVARYPSRHNSTRWRPAPQQRSRTRSPGTGPVA